MWIVSMLEHSCSRSSAMQSYQTITLACLRWKRFTPYWNGNVIFVKFSVMASPEVVKMRIWRSCCLKISAVLFRPRYFQGNGPFLLLISESVIRGPSVAVMTSGDNGRDRDVICYTSHRLNPGLRNDKKVIELLRGLQQNKWCMNIRSQHGIT